MKKTVKFPHDGSKEKLQEALDDAWWMAESLADTGKGIDVRIWRQPNLVEVEYEEKK